MNLQTEEAPGKVEVSPGFVLVATCCLMAYVLRMLRLDCLLIRSSSLRSTVCSVAEIQTNQVAEVYYLNRLIDTTLVVSTLLR